MEEKKSLGKRRALSELLKILDSCGLSKHRSTFVEGDSPNERKIIKLCEYAARNPFRIPKIPKYLEERCYKELRLDHVQMVNVITEVYSNLICMCKEQMAYFAVNLLNDSIELLDDSKRDTVQIIGCQTLTRFIYSQVDGTHI